MCWFDVQNFLSRFLISIFVETDAFFDEYKVQKNFVMLQID